MHDEEKRALLATIDYSRDRIATLERELAEARKDAGRRREEIEAAIDAAIAAALGQKKLKETRSE